MSDLPPPPPPSGSFPPPPPPAAPPGAAPGSWTPPPGWVPPPPPPGYQPPVPEIVETARHPIRRVIGLVLGFFFLGVTGLGVYLSIIAFLEQNREINAMPRGPIPVAELELEADDRETIHIEADHLGDGDSDSPDRRAERIKASALRSTITVTGPDGQNIPVEDVLGESVYGFSREGIAVGRIAVPVDGTYTIEVRGFDGEGDDGEVAVGDVSFGNLFVKFGTGLGLFIVGLMLAIGSFALRKPRVRRS